MKNLPASPMQGLLSRAAQKLPAKTGAVDVQRERMERRAGALVILADVSISMESPAWSGKRKIDVLREAVALVQSRQSCRLIAFSDSASECCSVPEPSSNTNLVAGLVAARVLNPGVTLLISDGRPDNEAAALAAAADHPGAIDVLYIGPETDATAQAFMRRLAAAGRGDVKSADIGTERGQTMLTDQLMKMLPSP